MRRHKQQGGVAESAQEHMLRGSWFVVDKLQTLAAAGFTLALASALIGPAAAQTVAPQAVAPAASAPLEVVQFPRVYVPGKRVTDIGPLPGLAITKDQIPANVQSATKEEIKASRALNIGDYMNSQMQGVNVNDYAGNPFQLDVNYRGFTASPQVGTPQGLSVFFDGVRINEPFGDVVNWDLIPLNAIERFDLFPGSNPLFGLNTLGGAISVRSKNGFTAPGVEGELLGGSWGRRQVKLAAGGSLDDTLAGFIAYTGFREDGWRDNSPSRVNQWFGRGDLRLDRGSVFLTSLYANNELIGNGLIPLALYEQRPQAVFTSPDRSQNRVLQFTLGGQFDLSEQANLTGQVYSRKSKRQGLGGDIYEGFDEMTGRRGGYFDPDHPELGSQPRNGAFYNLPGAIPGTPIGLVTDTALDQNARGASLQFNWNGDRHSAMVGVSIDRSESTYAMFQQLGLIDASHNVYLAPAELPNFLAGYTPIPGNNFGGTSTTKSLYASDTWTVSPKFIVNTAARYNLTQVDNHLSVRSGEGNVDLHELLPTTSIETTPTAEAFSYRSFNPSIGLNWIPTPNLNLFGNVSRGARTPSGVELGCAFDDTLVPYLVSNGPDQPPSNFGMVARSLIGPGCNLPTTLSGDPYLPQIRSLSYELGARGTLATAWEWNASVFQTDLKDDIYFVGVGVGRSYFDTVGKTRRRGLELGIKGTIGPLAVKGSYTYTIATFESPFYALSPHNSSADFDQNSRTNADLGYQDFVLLPTENASKNGGRGTFRQILVEPGARLPGIPAHALNLNTSLQLSTAWKLGVGMQVRSLSYVRGNENNLHTTGGSDKETGQYYCNKPCAANSDVDGFIQNSTRPGRTFTQKGTVPGFAVFSLDTSFEVSKGFSVFAQITNLFDRKYYTAGRLGINPFSPSTVGAIGPSGWNYNSAEWQQSTLVGPGAPRGIFVGLTYALGGN